MSFFRGTSIDQDSRYFSQHKKLLAKLTFPPCFDQKVDLAKVKLEVINQWVTERVTQILGFEDDIVVSMIINLLEPKVDQKLDPREMQITITGFLEKEAPSFMKELWELLLSAQAHPTGIPAELLEKKKQEMAKAAKEKADLRQVLDRKQQEAGHARPAGPRREGRGGRGRGRFADRREDSHGDRESSRPSNFRHRDDGDRRSERRRSPRRRRRSPSRSRSRSRTRRSSRRHSRSASRSKSRSRTPPRRRRSSRRSSSSSASDRSRSRSPRRSTPRRRRYSSSKSPSPDRRRRERRRSRSSSASS